MSFGIGQVVDVVAQRIRDAGGSAVSRADVRQILGHVERLVAYRLDLNREWGSFTTQPGRTLYDLDELVTVDSQVRPAALRRILHQAQDLDKITFATLAQTDPHWLRASGEPQAWAQYGLTHFVVWPAATDVRTLLFEALPLWTLFTDDTQAMHIREEWTPVVIDLTVVVLLTRLRLFATIPGVLERITQVFGLVAQKKSRAA